MWILLKLLLITLQLVPTAKRDLVLENLALRHQLAVCARPRRPHLYEADRRFWSSLARVGLLGATPWSWFSRRP